MTRSRHGGRTEPTSVALVTLGCARNDVDSEELAGRLESDGFRLVDDAAEAETIVVNTCGFVEAAKKDSIDTVLQAADLKSRGRARAVVTVGCLAERYGAELAAALPESDAVFGFDDYPDLGARLHALLAGEPHTAHRPRDRRALLPIAPVQRGSSALSIPGHAVAPPDLPPGVSPASGPRPVRRRIEGDPTAAVKLASGCDRRCSFCAIPSFRGVFVSRQPYDVLTEARWLVEQGARELYLVSENTTSYGKDLGDLRSLERLLPQLAEIDGVARVRLSYLQPAELRPSLIAAMTDIPRVAAYFDLSFQHASGPVLRAMRRFGDGERFLALLDAIRARTPTAGVRSNVIVGFPGETPADLDALCDFLQTARLDAIGVFGYSDEDGTEAAGLAGKLDAAEIRARTEHVTSLAEELTAQRAEDRRGEVVDVLVERTDGSDAEGRTDFQGPDVDGTTTVRGVPAGARPGAVLPARVSGAAGVDLVAEVVP